MAIGGLGGVFDQVPELYDRVRPSYPPELIADLVATCAITGDSSVLEVGCGTGQATLPLAEIGCRITAIEPGKRLAEVAHRRLAHRPNVAIEPSTFETWDACDDRFDLLMAASSWHWVDPMTGWRKAHGVLRPDGWMALLGHVVIREPGEPEVYAETADLHHHFAPDSSDWRHPPLEADVRATGHGWGPPNEDRDGLFGPTLVRWYPMVQRFDGAGFADLLRTLSPYRRLDPNVRESLLDAVADRIRMRLDDQATRRYLAVLRVGRRLA